MLVASAAGRCGTNSMPKAPSHAGATSPIANRTRPARERSTMRQGEVTRIDMPIHLGDV